MTATANKAVLLNMQSKLAAMGHCKGGVTIGEPKDAPGQLTAAIILDGGEIPETVLNAPRETHRVLLRFYRNAIADPRQNIEFELDEVRAEIEEDICGDFDLGGTIAYALPTEFRWQYGYQTVGQTMFRILDLTVAYRVDPAATFVQ